MTIIKNQNKNVVSDVSLNFVGGFLKNPIPIYDSIKIKETRIKELEAMLTWRSMETAPRDARPILAMDINSYDPHDQGWYEPDVIWYQAFEGDDGTEENGWVIMHSDIEKITADFTHWMPLPKPPLPTDQK